MYDFKKNKERLAQGLELEATIGSANIMRVPTMCLAPRYMEQTGQKKEFAPKELTFS